MNNPVRHEQSDDTLENLKLPPQSLQTEQLVLGGLLIDNAAWDTVADKVSAEDFYRRGHQIIFRTIVKMMEMQCPVDVVTLAEKLKVASELEAAGGLAYLINLADDTPSAANIATYASIVRDKAVLRQLISVGTNIANAAFQPQGRDTPSLLEYAEQQVFQIAEQGRKGQGGFTAIKALLARTVHKIEELFEAENPITGVSTGFTDLDEYTSGLQPADLIIIAGRPSMGKTAVSMNIAENVALTSKLPVAIFSMEMPSDALTMRMMSSLGRIDQHKVRTGKLDEDDWPRITSAINLLAETKLFIDDTAALSPIELRARARRLAREQGQLGLIVIDYLQLMQSTISSDNEVDKISDISRGLKALAKELNVPVIALSQLNRNLEQRPNKRPIMSDLRSSGAIEQDADLILFIYRDEVYNPNSADKGIAELIIGKQRNGPLGTVRLTFLGQYTRFENCYNGQGASDAYE